MPKVSVLPGHLVCTISIHLFQGRSSERERSASLLQVMVSPMQSPFGGGSKMKPRGLSREAGRVRRDGEG